MLRIITIALAFGVLIVAEVNLQPRFSGEVCNYDCLLGLELVSLDQRL